MRLLQPDTFVSKKPEENDREEVLTTHGNLLYNTKTDKFLSTLNGKLSWEDQSAYFVPNKDTGHTDEKNFNNVVKFVTVEEGMQSVIVPSTAYRQRKTAFRYDVFVETNFGLAFPYVKFIQEQASENGANITASVFDPLNQRGY